MKRWRGEICDESVTPHPRPLSRKGRGESARCVTPHPASRFALEWAELLGGLHALIARADANAAAVDAWVSETAWIEHLAADPATRSNTSVCLKFAAGAVGGLDEEAQRALSKRMEALLEAEGAAYDVAAYRDAPPGIRIWCGATVETEDVVAVGPWLDWAFHEAVAR